MNKLVRCINIRFKLDGTKSYSIPNLSFQIFLWLIVFGSMYRPNQKFETMLCTYTSIVLNHRTYPLISTNLHNTSKTRSICEVETIFLQIRQGAKWFKLQYNNMIIHTLRIKSTLCRCPSLEQGLPMCQNAILTL